MCGSADDFSCRWRDGTMRIEAAEVFADAVASSLGERRIVVASPDIGGIKRAQKLREILNRQLGRDVDFAFVEKRRARGIVSGETLVGRGC